MGGYFRPGFIPASGSARKIVRFAIYPRFDGRTKSMRSVVLPPSWASQTVITIENSAVVGDSYHGSGRVVHCTTIGGKRHWRRSDEAKKTGTLSVSFSCLFLVDK